ncbi:MAG: purine-binding chemotaxis protein [Moraxellaceae bacterium]|jgi:chemotaxis signal transduction protein|nr:purine-binding chemotaxis protein [Moraxellaceae bacterium]
MTTDRILQFLVVEVGGQSFAVPTTVVGTAVAARPVTPLPFVPGFVEGLVNINERIVPQIDLGLLLAAEPVGPGGELVLVETSRSPCALHVAHIVGKADIDPAALQPIPDDSGTLPVQGRFEWQQQSVLVLDVDRLGSLISSNELPAGERGLLGRLQGIESTQQEATLDCIVVLAGREKYALALTDVVEILDLPPATPVPGAPAPVEGLAMVRDEVLLVLFLSDLLHSGTRPEASARGVVVIQREGCRYGLRIDALEGLHRMAGEQLRRIDEGGGEVAGVLAAADQLLALLTPQRLISEARHRQFQPFVPQARQVAAQEVDHMRAVLQVALGNEVFGIALGHVRRITDYRTPESVQADDRGLVCGAVNVEGRVVPVVDLGGRLHAGTGNEGAWVIVGDGTSEWAIAVREATGILEIPDSALEGIGSGADSLVQGVANVAGQLISLLNLSPLMTTAAGGRHG